MFLTRAAELALQALPLLDARGPKGEGRHVRDLAEEMKAPAPFLGKVLQDLAKKGLLRGKRGRGGGFVLGRPASEIRLADVVLALEGRETLEDVFPRIQGPAGELLEKERRATLKKLVETSVAELARLHTPSP